MPKVTVLTPTFNRPDTLAAALRSVAAQELTDWELIVINDGGTDVTGVVAALGDDRVRLISAPENRGKAACLNDGLRQARGDYIAYLDDDDVWYPDHLERLGDQQHLVLRVALRDDPVLAEKQRLRESAAELQRRSDLQRVVAALERVLRLLRREPRAQNRLLEGLGHLARQLAPADPGDDDGLGRGTEEEQQLPERDTVFHVVRDDQITGEVPELHLRT